MAFVKAGLWGPQAIIDAAGHPQPGAVAAVYLSDEVTLVSLWSTSAKGVAAPNPTQADIHANLHFYADPGLYRLKVTVGGVVTWLDVEVPIDPGEAAQDQDVVAAQAAAEAYADGIMASGLATKQPLDADLTAIAALSTTAFGRSFLALADAAAGQTLLSLGTAATQPSTAFDPAGTAAAAQAASQPLDSDLTAIAALSTTAFGRSVLALADAAALRTAAGLGSAATHATGDFEAAGTAAAAVAALIAGAPGALDTLNELATALADDANFATTITNALAGKQQALARTAVKTANYSAAAGDLVPVDTTSAAVTVTLPNAPADKSMVCVKHIIQGGTNAVSIICAGSDVFNQTGGGTTATLPYLNQAMLLEYTASGGIWSVIADDLPLSQLDIRYAPATGIGESAVTGLVTDLASAVKVTGGGVETIHNNNAATGAVSVNLALGNWHLLTLTGNTTLSFTGATASKACSFTLVVTQDGSGGHSLTLPVSVVWAGGVAPVFSTTAGAVSYLSFASTDGGATWVGFGSTLPTNVASGYLLLDGSALTPRAQLGTGSADQTKFLRGDATWQTIPADYFNWSMEGTLYVKVGSKRLYLEGTRTILGVRASVGTVPTGATVIVDVNKNGTTIFTTQANRPTVAISANTSGAVTNMDIAALTAGDYLSVDVDQVGSTITGADLTVQVRLLGAQ